MAFGTLSTRGGIELAVRADWAGAGLEDAELQRWEPVARERGHAEVHRHLPADDAEGRARLEARGWRVARTGWTLALEADVPVVDAPLPEGYVLRPMTERDVPAVHDVVTTAFAAWSSSDRSYADWRAGSVDRPDVTPAHCLVAVHEDAVVGACLVVDPADPGPGAEQWVQQLAVDARHRRRGLARALLARTALAARGRGVGRLGLYTHADTGALGLYEGVGMVVRHTMVECVLTL